VIYSLCFQNGLLVIELEFFHSHQTPAKNNPKGKMTELADFAFWFYEMPRLKAQQWSTRRCQKRKERLKLTHEMAQKARAEAD
jgi:hypothetical protein